MRIPAPLEPCTGKLGLSAHVLNSDQSNVLLGAVRSGWTVVDMAHIGFTMLNVIIALLILSWTIIGARYLKSGILVRTMRRLAYTSLFLVFHFLGIAIVAVGILPDNTIVDDVSGVLFMVALWYTTYSFVNDWKKLS